MEVQTKECSRCKKTMSITDFREKKNGKGYIQKCRPCEEKSKRKGINNGGENKDNTSGITIEKEQCNKKKEKRLSGSTTIGKWVQEQVLKEQQLICRGPNEGECKWYFCPTNKCNLKLIIDGPDPEYDHIKPIEDNGSNDIQNIQALCGICHNKKSKLERLIKNGYKTKEIEETYQSLSIPKSNYQGDEKSHRNLDRLNISDSESDSESDSGDVMF